MEFNEEAVDELLRSALEASAAVRSDEMNELEEERSAILRMQREYEGGIEDLVPPRSAECLTAEFEERSQENASTDPYLDGDEAEEEESSAGATEELPRALKKTSTMSWTTLRELGIELAKGMARGELPEGVLLGSAQAEHTAPSGAFYRGRGVFPLPVDFEGCLTPLNESEKEDDGANSWLQLISFVLNQLAGKKEPYPVARRGEQVMRIRERLLSRIRRFLEEDHKEVWDGLKLWEDLKRKKVNYEGEELGTPEPLTKEQILRSVPPLGHGASVELAPLVTGRSRHLLLHPEDCILPRGERKPGRNQGRVHIARGEELGVWSLLRERGVVDWFPLADVYGDEEGRYLAGMFGVEKPGKMTESGKPVLRVIMNLKNINRTLSIIKGDIEELPHATMWTQLCLHDGVELEMSQADMQSAFYLFRMPPVWQKFFCFNCIFDGATVGLPHLGQVVPSCLVLPMGWASSVGLMQQASRHLMMELGKDHGAELRKQALAPEWFVDVLADSQSKSWWQVYLDNYFAGGLKSDGSSDTRVKAMHKEAVDAWTKAGVLSAEDKHIIAEPTAVELGVHIGGKTGLMGASSERLAKLAVVTLKLLETRMPKTKWVQIVLGRWIFALQFRRPAMAVLAQCWKFAMPGEDKRRWWPTVRRELSRLLAIIPLLQMDLRMPFASEVTCSDASEFGGAMAVSTGLTQSGKELAQRLQLPCAAEILVISAFNGVGGAFRAYDLAGVRPMGLISIEIDKAARRVTRKAWPGAIEVVDIRLVDLAMVKEWANQFPRVKEVHIYGGFPCVHLSSVRAGRKNLAGEGSILFWNLKDLIDMCCEVFGPTATVKFVVENVLSMDVSAREEISAVLDVMPLALCPSDCLCYGRPRLAWCSKEMTKTEGIEFEQCRGYIRVHMSGASLEESQWADEGWTRTSSEILPTFMKAIARTKPQLC